jgi:ABC-2 type transport system ATP-binding protein
MIETAGLRRVYVPRRSRLPRRRRTEATEKVALDSLTLRVEAGETHGLLGPNGAGKTTLARILATVLTPTSGTASVNGHDVSREPARVRRDVGIVFGGDRGLYGRLTARQNLRFWGAVAGLPRETANQRTEALLDRLGLADRATDRVETFSRGMKQRLHLARGLIADPQVVILDEPTTGMDPVGTREFRELIKDLRADGKTLLITTHDMVEAEELCDRVSLIDRGKLLFTESPQNIGRFLTGHEGIEFRLRDDAGELAAQLKADLAVMAGVTAVESADGLWRVQTSRDALGPVLSYLASHDLSEIATRKPTLEQVYLHFVGDRGLKV